MFGPGRYITKKAFQSLRRGIFNQHVLPEAGAFAGLLGGFLRLFVFSGFPTVHFFAVSVFITTYHIPLGSTPVSPSGRGPRRPSRASSTSSRTLPVASHREQEIEEVPVDDLEVDSRVRRQARRERPCRRRRRRRKLNGRRVGLPPASPSPSRRAAGRRGDRR